MGQQRLIDDVRVMSACPYFRHIAASRQTVETGHQRTLALLVRTRGNG